MTRLNHPNIVRVYHYGLHEGHPWLTMEMLKGTPAQAWAKDARQAGHARAHPRGPARRHPARARAALRPRPGAGAPRPQVRQRAGAARTDGSSSIDFGTAHLDDAAVRPHGRGRVRRDLRLRQSPEQLSGRRSDRRERPVQPRRAAVPVVHGRRPFTAEDNQLLIDAHLTQAAPGSPHATCPSWTSGWSRLILQLLAKKPADRPQRPNEVSDRLEAMRDGFQSPTPLMLHSNRATGREQLRNHEIRAAARSAPTGPPRSSSETTGPTGPTRRGRPAAGRASSAGPGVPLQPARGSGRPGLMGMLKVIGREAKSDDGDKAVRALRKITRPTPPSSPSTRSGDPAAVGDVDAVGLRARSLRCCWASTGSSTPRR